MKPRQYLIYVTTKKTQFLLAILNASHGAYVSVVTHITTTASMGKGKLWLLSEDKALAEAWVEVAESASAGPDDTFWSLVHANWVARPGGSQRSEQALKNHWRYLQDAVRTFGKYVREALAESSSDAPSAESTGNAAPADAEAEPVAVSDDVTERALRLYLDAERESFTLVPVWSVLHKSAKWHSSKTPGSSLKRSRATNGYAVKSEKVNKRLSLPAGVGNGQALATEAAAPAPAPDAPDAPAPSHDPKPNAATTARARAADRRLSLPAPAAAAPTDATPATVPAVAAEPRSFLRTSKSTSATDAARVRQSMYSTAAEQLASALRDANDSAAHEMLRTLIVANDPVRTSVAPERDSYAASIAELAAAQAEKNALVADQMLMTILLADPADATNQKALAQLKRKYMQRAFPGAATDAQ